MSTFSEAFGNPGDPLPGAGGQSVTKTEEINESAIDNDELLDRETAEVMKARLAKKSRGSYLSRVIAFMVWILDNCTIHYLMNSIILSQLVEADQIDKSTLTRRGKPTKQRKRLRAACKSIIEAINPEQSHSIPVKLE